MVSVNAMRFCGICCLLLSAQAFKECEGEQCQEKIDDSVSLIQLTNSVGKRKAPSALESVIETKAGADNAKTESTENSENPANITVYIAGMTPPPLPMGGPVPPAAPMDPMAAVPPMAGYPPMAGAAMAPPMMPPMAPPAAMGAQAPPDPNAGGSNITIIVNPDLMDGGAGGFGAATAGATTLVPQSYAQAMGYGGGMPGMGMPGMPMGQPGMPAAPMGSPCALQTDAESEKAETVASDNAKGTAQLLSKGDATPWQAELLSGSAQAGYMAGSQFQATAGAGTIAHSSSAGNAAALIKAGVQKIASQAAFAGVKSGITAGVQKGVAAEGFGGGGGSAMQTGSLASPAAGAALAAGPATMGMNNVTIVVRQNDDTTHDIEAAHKPEK